AVELHVDVPAGDTGIREPEVGVLTAADHVAADPQLVPELASVDREQVPGPALRVAGLGVLVRRVTPAALLRGLVAAALAVGVVAAALLVAVVVGLPVVAAVARLGLL